MAVSAHAMESDAQRGLDHGFDGYLTKPLNLPTFMAMLRKQFKLE